MSEQEVYGRWVDARHDLRRALGEFKKSVDESERDLVDEFNELVVEVEGYDALELNDNS
jgi:hypothetical protein